MKTETKRKKEDMTTRDERLFRELGERFLRSTDPEEQSRLKTELARSVLRRLRSRTHRLESEA